MKEALWKEDRVQMCKKADGQALQPGLMPLSELQVHMTSSPAAADSSKCRTYSQQP